MIRNERRAYRNMAIENSVYNTTCTTYLYYNKQLTTYTELQNCLNFHPALYSLTRKAVILNTSCIVRKYLTEQLIKKTWPVRHEPFCEPTSQL